MTSLPPPQTHFSGRVFTPSELEFLAPTSKMPSDRLLSPYKTNFPFGLVRVVNPFMPPKTLLKSFLSGSIAYIKPGTLAEGLVVIVIILLLGQRAVHSVKGESNT